MIPCLNTIYALFGCKLYFSLKNWGGDDEITGIMRGGALKFSLKWVGGVKNLNLRFMTYFGQSSSWHQQLRSEHAAKHVWVAVISH